MQIRGRTIGTGTICRAALLLALLSPPNAFALIVDQSNLSVTFSGIVYNISVIDNFPIGQEFRPSLASMDFVDLWIQDSANDIGPGASVQVFVRAGAINGPNVGASNATLVPDGTNLGGGTTLSRFTFSTPVSLNPGSTYVLQVRQTGAIVPGNQSFGWGGSFNGAGTYPNGRAIVHGDPLPGDDFWFQEGVLVPEPGTVALIGGAIAVMTLTARPRPSHRRHGMSDGAYRSAC